MQKVNVTETQHFKNKANTLLDEPVKLEIDIKPKSSIHRFMQKHKILPAKKVLLIHGLTMGALIRISNELLSIDLSVYDLKNLLESNYKAMAEYSRTFAKIIAIAARNAPENSYTEHRLIDFILNNFTAKELKVCMNVVISQMSVESFMSSIISVKGMNILEMKKTEMSLKPGELIASGPQSEVQ